MDENGRDTAKSPRALSVPPAPGGPNGPNGPKRPRHFGASPSRASRTMSALLIFFVMGLGVVAGTFLAKNKTTTVESTKPTRPFHNGQGQPQLYGKIQPPKKDKLYWGAFRLDAPYRTSLVTSLENLVHRRPAVLMWYQEWADKPDFPVDEAAWLYDRGIVPMITWEPWQPPKVFGDIVNDQPKFSLKRIADGDWDKYITRYARDIKNYGGPVMLRPMHEMDGFWYPWSGTVQTAEGNSPTEYKKAWRHIWRVFTYDVKATNVTWVWSVNHVSVPDTSENEIQNYWPGKKFVDWIGFSGFNWGTASPASVWKGFDSVERDRYRELLRWGKPIALTEMGAPEVGGDKARWIKDSFRDIFTRYPRLKMVIWYDKQDSPERQWQIDSSEASVQAFRKAIADPRVLEADAAQVTATPHGKP